MLSWLDSHEFFSIFNSYQVHTFSKALTQPPFAAALHPGLTQKGLKTVWEELLQNRGSVQLEKGL